MPSITTSEDLEISDEKIRAVADQVYLSACLAAERAVANHEDSTKFPLASDASSFEQIFSSRFRELPRPKQLAAKAKVMPSIRASAPMRRYIYKNIADVGRRAAISFESQPGVVLPVELQFPKSHLATISEIGGHSLRRVMAASRPGTSFRSLEFRIHAVKCVDETGAGWLGEMGKDEIYLGGTSVDTAGVTKKISKYKVGNFDDGKEKQYDPPTTFTAFALTDGLEWPRAYFVTLVLAEVDMGGLADFLNRLLEKVRAEVIAALTAAIGAAAGVGGGPLGVIIGAAVGYAVGKIFEWLKTTWSDDIFKPRTLSIGIPAPDARFPDGRTHTANTWVKFNGHNGEYKVLYDWRLVM